MDAFLLDAQSAIQASFEAYLAEDSWLQKMEEAYLAQAGGLMEDVEGRLAGYGGVHYPRYEYFYRSHQPGFRLARRISAEEMAQELAACRPKGWDYYHPFDLLLATKEEIQFRLEEPACPDPRRSQSEDDRR